MPENRSRLIGPRAKLDRAFEHLEALNAGCQAFLESDPYDAPIEFEPESGDHVMRFSVRDSPPLRLGTIVGDIVHNVRSSLDHVAWLMACQTTPVEKLWKADIRRNVYFPVTHHRNEFTRHSVMPYLTEPCKAALDGMQPYHREKSNLHPLALLNTFWNTDKHRVLFASYAGFDISGIKIRPASLYVEALQEMTVEWMHPNEAQDGTEIVRVRIGDGLGPPEAHVRVDGKPAAEIFFGAGGLQFKVVTLGAMVEFAAEALPLFDEVLNLQR